MRAQVIEQSLFSFLIRLVVVVIPLYLMFLWLISCSKKCCIQIKFNFIKNLFIYYIIKKFYIF